MPGRRARSRIHRRAKKTLASWLFPLAIGTGCQQAPHVDSTAPSQRCVTCHLAEYQSVSHPPHPGVRPTTCGSCHLDTSWHPYRLNHSWPLEGAHAKANCFDCHRGEPRQFEGTSKECLSCHRDDDEKANQKIQRHEQFGTICQTCHTAIAWKPTLPHEGAATDATEPAAPKTAEAAPQTSPKTAKAVPPATGARAASTSTSTTRKTPPIATSTPGRTPKPKPDSVTGASPVWRK